MGLLGWIEETPPPKLGHCEPGKGSRKRRSLYRGASIGRSGVEPNKFLVWPLDKWQIHPTTCTGNTGAATRKRLGSRELHHEEQDLGHRPSTWMVTAWGGQSHTTIPIPISNSSQDGLTNYERFRIHLYTSPLCPGCRSEEESVIHQIRDCQYATSVWRELDIPQDFFRDDGMRWIKTQASNKQPWKHGLDIANIFLPTI